MKWRETEKEMPEGDRGVWIWDDVEDKIFLENSKIFRAAYKDHKRRFPIWSPLNDDEEDKRENLQQCLRKLEDKSKIVELKKTIIRIGRELVNTYNSLLSFIPEETDETYKNSVVDKMLAFSDEIDKFKKEIQTDEEMQKDCDEEFQ